ncbi:cyclic nucleotide-gated cation channel beta-3 [Musca domestica]|uniref:Cyclic nucleotide-gated cation channel beta-3 n=1 Tax=Musca domestica TaxID=7370 RepID=A0A1I8MMZ3_MUSDO|nr:cyclic nucleotide-gated cation channel beta-3 [Musca domestica]
MMNMENMGRLRKPANAGGNDTQLLLKSSPNILENFPYEDFKLKLDRSQPKRMTSPPIRHQQTTSRSKSPLFCDTLERHAFMQNVINTKSNTRSNYDVRYSSPSQKEATVRRSLEEISKDIKEIEDFLTVTEQVLKQERELDMQMELEQKKKQGSKDGSPNKENKSPSPTGNRSRRNSTKSVTYKINSFRNRKKKNGSPRFLNSRLYFRNGRIGCLEAENATSNVESTHALVKHILKYENEKPLVSPESVRRVLSAGPSDSPPMTESRTPRKLSGLNANHTTLPGQVSENPNGREESFEMQPLQDVISKAAGKVLLDHGDSGVHNSPQTESFGSNSQPLVDEDEQDVQICYDELPELPNEEHNMGALMDSEMDVNDCEIPAHVIINRLSSADSLDSEGQQFLRDQVRHLVRRFTARANKMKTRLEMPPTPSSSASSPSPPPPAINSKPNFALASSKGNEPPVKKNPTPQQTPNKKPLFVADTPRSNVWLCSSLCSTDDQKTLDPQGTLYISWLCVVSISFLYNAWVIPLRSTFPFQTPENTNTWLILDFCADIVYLVDVVFFKHRIMYLFEGFWVKDKNLTRKNYMRKLQFKLDLLALLPLELLYFKYGTKAVYLRFPRFLKIQSFWEFFKLLDRVISSPHIVRIAKTLLYMLYMIHLTATFYYAYSVYEGLGTNRWVFNGKGHPYVRCFAFATKTATSIGKNPKPEHEGEYLFMTAAWLMGVFVFALLIGQIRDIISTATRTKNEYRQLEDETLEYMRRLNLPQEVQKRVKMWFKFTWDQQRTLDESNILDSLPINLKTDIAISVHIQTLSKVQLFADCEEALLRDLVLKLRAVTFLPGDYVCRKGEVGREMYIIKLGQVQVMGGPNNDTVLATLYEGSVFGEISLLGINGADRRTADVRSKGYANLFVLSKSDLNEVIAYYPNAQSILKKRARALMRKNAAREKEERARSAEQADVVIGNPKTPENPPKLLQTVIQALPYESPAVMLITRGSKRMRKKRHSVKMETIEDREVEEINEGQNQIKARDSFMLPRDSKSYSPDLLSSIQRELESKHQFINLTDSEKALIISTSSNDSVRVEDIEEYGK